MKRKLDDSIENSSSVKRGCYFQTIQSVLFRKENRLNAFEKMKNNLIESKSIEQSICSNCQQLKKENRKISPGVLCYFCEKFVCFDCVRKCSNCDYDFCSFCSIQLYDETDSVKCLNC